jgi:hypothetical protein
MTYDQAYRDMLDREIGLIRYNRGADPGTPRIVSPAPGEKSDWEIYKEERTHTDANQDD